MTNQIDKAPTGATHRYEHANNVDWYCQAEQGLYRWQQGSWCASVHKTIEDLANSCPLGRLVAIPAERAQPADDDLTWLVRMTGGALDPWCEYIARSGENSWACTRTLNLTLDKQRTWFTKAQYLERKAELQNKPSFADHPDAKCFVQMTGGGWYKNKSDVELVRSGSGATLTSLGVFEPICRGEVIGDWRDTLERRPEHTRAEMEVELVKAAFQPFTSIEDNQEQEMKQDNDWFERGELPPVGVECQAKLWDRDWATMTIKGYHENTVWAGTNLCILDKAEFRPIRTERDELIDVLKNTHAAHLTNLDMLASAILAAGFKRGDA